MPPSVVGIITEDYLPSGAAPSPQTFNHTTTPDTQGIVVLSGTWNGSVNPIATGVTFNGVALTQIVAASKVNDQKASIWVLTDDDVLWPSPGTYLVSVSYDADFQCRSIVVNLTDLDSVNPATANASAVGNATNPSASIPSTTAELVIGLVAFYSAAPNSDAGDTPLGLSSVGGVNIYGFSNPGSAIVTFDSTHPAAVNFALVCASFQSGGGGTTLQSSAVSVSAESTLSGIGSLLLSGESAVTAESSFHAVGLSALDGMIQIAAESAASGVLSGLLNGIAEATGLSDAAAIPAAVLGGSGEAAAESSIAGIPSTLFSGSVSIVAEAIVSAVGTFDIVLISGAGSIEAVSTVSGVGSLLLSAKATLATDSDLSAVASMILSGSVSIEGVTAIEAAPGLILAGAGVMEAISEISASGSLSIEEILHIISIKAKFTQAKSVGARFTQAKPITAKF